MGFQLEPKAVASRISRRKAQAADFVDEKAKPRRKKVEPDEDEFLQAYEEYQNGLEASNLLDYDDLLIRCAELLQQYPQCVSNVEAVLIDEFQDTNTIQLSLMKLFASRQMRVTIVGDPDQSIYGFRSAEIRNLTRMQLFYPGTIVINLEENYRSSAALLRCAQEVIEQDMARPSKTLKPTHCHGSLPVLRKLPSAHDEATWIVTEIKRITALSGNLTTFSDFAILLRSAHLSLLIEKALSKEAIPYRMVGGFRFFDREEVRILLDYLATISHPDNDAALRAIINVPARKIGPEALKELTWLADNNNVSLWSLVQKVICGNVSLRKKLTRPAEKNLARLVGLIKEARRQMREVPVDETPKYVLEFCISRLRFQEFLRSKHPDDHANRWANVEELIAESRVTSDLSDPSQNLPENEGVKQAQLDGNQEALSSFLANITLSSDKNVDGQDQECVTISTIHSAKGLEWPIVFIPAVYNGSIPHSRAEDTDEERRLLYVAMTRAQALLYLTWPLRQSHSDIEAKLSQFLPTKMHRYFTALAPNITETVVRDVSLILGRDAPCEDEILSSMRRLSEKESVKDDIWPEDGSARPYQWWEQDTKALKSGDYTASESRMYNQLQTCQDKRDPLVCQQVFSTFTSNSGFGFSTAAQQLHKSRDISTSIEPSCQSQAFSRSAQAKRRPKGGKGQGDQGQARLTTLFGGPRQAQIDRAAVDLPKAAHLTMPKPRCEIPSGFSSYNLPTKPLSLKRRQPLQEVVNSKRREYVFLSSSPTSESFQEAADSSNVVQKDTNSHQAHRQGLSQSMSPVASSLHTTSVDMIRRQQPGGMQKSYGIRRTLNGWENRKIK